MTVFTEDGVAIGSKAVSSPEIGSEFEFEEFLVTVEGARSAPFEDVTNHVLQPPSAPLNPPKFHKHVQQQQQHQQQQDASSFIDNAPESDCNVKFLVAYTRYALLQNLRGAKTEPALSRIFCRQKTQKNKRWCDGVATFNSSSGKFCVFSDDRNLLGSTTVQSAPCVGSEMDFSGMLVTINDELHEHISQTPAISPHITPQSTPGSHFSQPTALPQPFDRSFVGIIAPAGAPICRSDDEVLQMLMPRSMKLLLGGVSNSYCSGGGGGSSSSVGGGSQLIAAADSAPRYSTHSITNMPLPAPAALSQSTARFATSFRQLPGPKTSQLDTKAASHPPSAAAHVPKQSSARGSSAFADDFDADAPRHLHQSFKQPQGFTPTCIANSIESFHETLKQGVLQLPLDLDPAELSKMYEKRHISIPDSFSSLSEYSSTFRAAIWEGAGSGSCSACC